MENKTKEGHLFDKDKWGSEMRTKWLYVLSDCRTKYYRQYKKKRLLWTDRKRRSDETMTIICGGAIIAVKLAVNFDIVWSVIIIRFNVVLLFLKGWNWKYLIQIFLKEVIIRYGKTLLNSGKRKSQLGVIDCVLVCTISFVQFGLMRLCFSNYFFSCSC